MKTINGLRASICILIYIVMDCQFPSGWGFNLSEALLPSLLGFWLNPGDGSTVKG